MADPYDIELSNKIRKRIEKLQKRDPSHYKAVVAKIAEISENPNIGKPLRKVLKGRKRIHIGPFVLIYAVDDNNRIVTFLNFEHHDDAYKY